MDLGESWKRLHMQKQFKALVEQHWVGIFIVHLLDVSEAIFFRDHSEQASEIKYLISQHKINLRINIPIMSDEGLTETEFSEHVNDRLHWGLVSHGNGRHIKNFLEA